MKQLTLLFLLLLPFVKSFAQDTSVEKSLWGVQMGVHPLSFYNETALSNSITLRSELGFGFAYSSSSISGTEQWAVVPTVIVEPRYYYNLNRRTRLKKRTDWNSGNYLSLNLGYELGAFAITSKDTEVFSSVHLIPMYGFRRNMGAKFNFEMAFGIGGAWTFEDYVLTDYNTQKPITVNETDFDVAYGLRLAIGYVF